MSWIETEMLTFAVFGALALMARHFNQSSYGE